MNLGKPIRDPEPEKPEWKHTPTPDAPYLWTNTRTGMFNNRTPTPEPKYTIFDYMGIPKAVYFNVADEHSYLMHMTAGELGDWFGVGQ